VIEIESLVFSTVATALRSAFPGIFVSGETIPAPSKFPAATLVEADDSVYEKTSDSSRTENHALKMYQADTYSNLTSGKKAQAKAIMKVIDEQMAAMGFVRVGNSPGVDQSSYYRQIARYRGVVSAGVTVGEDTVLQIYRR
jgi:hypothetical protein